MTILTQTDRNIYAGNGVTLVFPYTFPIIVESDMTVTLIDADGVETLLALGADYTVSGEGSESGGNVTLLVAAPAVGVTILLLRAVPYTQPTDIKNQGSFYPLTYERMVDRLEMQIQQLKNRQDLSFELPAYITGVSTVLPAPAASELVGWDATAVALRNYSLAEIATSVTYGGMHFDTYTASAAQTDFTLTADPGALANLDVSVDGVTQVNGADFTYLGTTLTFVTPMIGGEVVLARYGQALPTGVTDADFVMFYPPGPGAVARTMQDKERDRLSVKDYGAAGDGVTDDTNAIEQASDGDAPSFVPEGVYPVTALDNGVGIGITLEGQGDASVIEKQAQGVAGPVYFFRGRIRLFLHRLALVLGLDPLATNGTNLFLWDHDDIDLRDIDADGEIEIDPGTGARNGIGNITTVSASVTPRTGMKVLFSKFRRFFWGILKSNTTASVENDITIALSEFDEFGAVQLLFNSPAVGAANENILVLGNKLGSVMSRQPFGSPIGFPHRTSFAGNISHVRFIGNHATGYGGEIFRSEEAAHAIIVAANTAKLDGKDGIEIVPNNVGGSLVQPTMHVIANNVIENVGLNSAPALGWGVAFHTYSSVVGYGPAVTESIMHDNVSAGWEYAYSLHWGAHRNLVHHNVAADSAEGIRTYQPSPGMQDNLIVDCPVALHVLGDTSGIGEGGLMGNTHFRSTANPPLPLVVDADMPVGLLGWTFETGTFDIANGATSRPIITLGDRIDGELVIAVTRSGVNYNFIRGTLTYDGATLTFTETLRHDSGSVAVSATALEVSGSTLNLRLFNSAGVTLSSYRVTLAFKGAHLFGVP